MTTPKPQIIAFSLIIVALIAIVVVDQIRFGKVNQDLGVLASHVETLENSFASTTNELHDSIMITQNTLSDQLSQNVGDLKDRLNDYRDEVGDVSDTVDTLQKLSKTDPELLAKYSKVFFLNENYAPARLVEIPNAYRYSDAKILKFNADVWPFLKEMIDDATKGDVPMYVLSAFRSFNEQQALKGQYTVIYGSGSANTFAADQGYSEHQLGTTIDMVAPGLGGVLDSFGDTKAYTWLTSNAYKYGFVLSYPKNNAFYVYEPWHWRFVGIKLATYLHKQNKTFYDMDQRDIDEYLVSFLDD